MRFALGIEYDGHGFYGWQAQENLLTVQGCLESALSKIADTPIKTFCAGRTDAGVHATGQVVHFETEVTRGLQAWSMGTNTHLPAAICVRWVKEVDSQFHARFSALSRRYRYVIYNHKTRPAILHSRVTWYYRELDVVRMQLAASHLLGEQDFSSFRAAGCESNSPMRDVKCATVSRQGPFVIFDIEANAFLQHMVRNIVGALMRIGAGLEEPDWMQTVLAAKDRKMASETAPPTGLYLTLVKYPSNYAIPEAENHSLFY